MEKITKKEKVRAIVEEEIPIYKTVDGKEFRTEKAALKHEALLQEFPKICADDLNWLEDLNDRDEFEDFKEALKTSDKVFFIMSSEGCGLCLYEEIDPEIKGVTAVAKLLQGRNAGMNAHEYIDGVIYKEESFSVEFEKGKEKRTVGTGRNIKDVLCQI